jgi:hypothetical protein
MKRIRLRSINIMILIASFFTNVPVCHSQNAAQAHGAPALRLTVVPAVSSPISMKTLPHRGSYIGTRCDGTTLICSHSVNPFKLFSRGNMHMERVYAMGWPNITNADADKIDAFLGDGTYEKVSELDTAGRDQLMRAEKLEKRLWNFDHSLAVLAPFGTPFRITSTPF